MKNINQLFEYRDSTLIMQRYPGDKIEIKMTPWEFVLLMRHGIYDLYISSRYRRRIENPSLKYTDSLSGILQFIKDENFKELGRYGNVILFGAKSLDDSDDIHFRVVIPELGIMKETCICFNNE